MDPCDIDIYGFWLEDADNNGPECAPIANQYHARLEIWRELSLKANSGLESASIML